MLKSDRIYYPIIFLISAVIIMMQLILTRVFSVILWYHFAFMAVSIAMLGISCAGLYLYFRRKQRSAEDLDKRIFLSSIFGSLFFFGVYILIFNTRIFLRYRLEDILYLGFIYINLTIAFTILAYGMALLITYKAENISKLYFYDLIGASMGCLLFIPVINKLGAEASILLFCSIGCLPSIISSFYCLKKKFYKFISIAVLSFFIVLTILSSFDKIPFFKIHFVKGRLESDTYYTEWNAFSRVSLYGLRWLDWGLSLVYDGRPLPHFLTMDIDACAGMLMVKDTSGAPEMEYLKYSITALSYLLKPESPIAIIGSGAGKDVLGARVCGVKEIYAIDINPIVEKIVNKIYGKFTNYLYKQPGIHFSLEDGRSFIRRSKKKFKIIQLSMVDTWAATTSGALSLAENSLYTVDAFNDFFDKLDDDGILTLTRFYFVNKPRECLRTLALAVEHYRSKKVPAYNRNIIITAFFAGKKKEVGVITFLFKKTAFTHDEIVKHIQNAENLKFEIEYIPSVYKAKPNYFSELIFAKDTDKFYKEYALDVSPTTDDRPFFFYLLKPADFLKAFNYKHEHSFNYIAVFVLIVSFVIILILTLLLLIAPLVIKIHHSFSDFRIINILLYFSTLGLGFMLIESSLIQRYILFLGHPIYSLSVVLFSMLIFSGFGSYFTNKMDEKKLGEYIIRAIIILVIVLLGYNYIIEDFFHAMIGLSQTLKIIIASFTLAIPAFLMGMPMPLAIRILAKNKVTNIIPWCWAVNGATSILGSIAAFIIALNFGFKMTLNIALFMYICVIFFSMYLKAKKGEM